MVNDCDALCGGAEESVTVTVKVEVAVEAGVPPKTPLLPSVIPVGSEPLVTPKVKGGVPPEIASDALYGLPAIAVGSACGAKTSRELLTVKLNVAVVVFAGALLSTSCTVNKEVHATVVVPLKIPLALSVMPGGSEPPVSVHVSEPTPPCSRRICV